MSPATSPVAGGTTITITGTGFKSGTSFGILVGSQACTSPQVVSPTTLTCVTPALSASVYDLTVTNGDGQQASLLGSITYYPAPSLTSVSPSSGSTAGGTTITLTGTNFLNGGSFGVKIGGVACGAVNYVSSTTITCVTPMGVAGATPLTVTNLDGQSSTLPGSFTYINGPAITSVSPNNGPVAGGTLITLTGSNFLAGASFGVTVGGSACTGATVVSSSSITCTTPAGSAGAKNIVVTNGDGQTGSLPNGFTYNPAPTITTISPSTGPIAGGTAITITGTGFLGGGSFGVTVGGAACTGASVVSATSITCTTPSGTAGAKNVVVTISDSQSVTSTGGFTYISPPTLSSISPSSGPTAGGTTITLTGTNFSGGGSFAIKVGGTACTTSTWVSSTQATCVTPAGSAGAQSVQIINADGQSSTLAGAFTYIGGPSLTSISPTSGPTAGGTTITLTGTGFTSGGSFAIKVGGTACSTSTWVSSTSATCVTPSGTAGAQSVQIINNDGQSSTLSSAFTYIAAPSLTSISPSSGPTSGGTTITLTGTNFTSGGSFGISVGGTACSTSTWVSATSATCVVPASTAGTKSVVITNNDGQTSTLASAFTYVAPPSLTSISPTNGPAAGGTTITLTGTNFTGGGSFSISVNAVACTTSTWVSSTQATCVAPAQSAGTYDVQIRNSDGQVSTLFSAYTYNPAPTITTVSPSSGPAAGGTAITITGTGFLGGGSFGVTVGGTACTSASVVSSTSITCTTPSGTAGARNVVVTISDGQSVTSTGGFTYVAAPTLTSVSPNNGAPAGGGTITLTGTGFTSGGSFGISIGGTACTTSTYVSATSATCVVPAGTVGAKNIVLTNNDGQTATLTGGYTYNGAPTITSISPNQGPANATTAITINGTNFVSGGSLGVTVGGSTCTSPSVVSSTQITCTVPALAAGTVNVVVTSGDGQGVTASNAFTYVNGPVVTGVSPSSGPLAGGGTVTITGSNFTSGGSFGISIGGTACTTSTWVSSTSATCVVPAGTAGAKSVLLTNSDGQTNTLTNGYTYNPAPTITSVSPSSGSTVGGTAITITGTGFVGGGSFGVTVGGSACASASVVSSTSITCNTPSGTAGAKNVVVTIVDGQSVTSTGAFTYIAPPSLTSISPTSGPSAGGTTITLTGTNFTSGGSFGIKVGGTACTTSTWVSATSATCVTPAGSAGAQSVQITNNDGQTSTLASAFTYIAPPSLTSISPTSGPSAGGTTITLTGTNFTSGGSFAIKVGGTACSTSTWVSSTSATCVTPSVSAGAQNVQIINNDGQSATLAGAFSAVAGPTLTSISPTSGPTAGGTTITLTGTNFVSGGSFGISVGGTACSTSTWISATSATCVTPSGTAGAKNVVITNNDGQTATLTNAFTYVAPPSLTSISPTSGPAAGGTTITLTGTNFTSGGSFAIKVGGTACTTSTWVSATSATCVTPSGTAGAQSVQIINNDGQSSTLASAFTYINAPSLTSISPTSGPAAGGTTITLTGTNFTSGGSFGIKVGGTACSTSTWVSATSATCVTPSGTAGIQNVVVTNNDGQTATLAGAFTYINAPSLTSISPTSGPTAGGTTLTLTGTNFTSGGSFGISVGGTACTTSTWVSATSATCVTPSGTAGAKSVVITNNDGQTSTLASAFTYVAPPSLTSISPTSGTTAGGTTITLTGTNFTSGGSFGIKVGGTACTTSTWVSATSATCVTPAGSAGAQSVQIINNDGQTSTLASAFTYITPPSLTSISPTSGTTAGGTTITLTGTNFTSGGSFGIKVGGTACTTSTWVSATSATCVTPAGSAGAQSVQIINNDGQSSTLASAFTYIAPPSLTSISPTSGPTAGGTTITLTGTGFTSGGSFAIKVGGTACSTSTWVSATSATCVTPSGTAGAQSVQIINNDGQSSTLASAFTYISAPSLTSVSPTSGPTAGGTTITLTGTNFTSGGSFAIKVNGTACTTSTWVSATSATCVTPSGTAGAKSVQIINNDGQSSTLASAFTYIAPPTLTSISPTSGPAAGGTTITLTGTNFTSGGSFGIKVGGTACSTSTWVSATSATCVTPSGTAGAQNVVITNNDGQTATLSSAFTYINAPSLTSISPTSGPTAGGTTITLTGTSFTSGGSFGIKVNGTACTTSTWVSATSATCVTPAGSAGAQSVQITNNDGQSSTLASAFTYVAPPSLTSISPTSGSTAGGTTITLTGTNFTSGGSFAIKVNGTACSTSTWVSATSATCVTPSGTTGAKSVQIINNDGQSSTLASAFTYVAPPTLTSISPTSGSTNGGTTITLTGTNFTSGGSFGISVGGSACSTSTWVSSTSATCVTPTGTTGAKNVVITNNDGQTATLTSAFTYSAPPTLTSISPTSGTTAGGTSISLTGTGFVNGMGFGISVGGTACSSFSVSSSTSATCTTPAGTAGAKNVVLTNNDGQTATLTNAFTYVAPAPTLTSVSPGSGTTAGGTTVTLTGTNFTSGGSFGITVGGTACTTSTWVSATSATCVTPAGTAGAKNVVITNNDGQTATLTNGFTYIAPPSLTSISPTSGPTAGGTTVTLTGTSFTSGGSFGIKVNGTACTTSTWVSATSATCVTPAGSAGTVAVQITNNDGQTSTLSNAFTYVAPPSLTSISPTSGTTSGGTTITLTGTGFTSGGSFGISVGGTACSTSTWVSSTSATCVTPSGTAGAKSVVITNSDGQTSTLASAFTYITPPTLTSISPTSGGTSGGTTITLTGTNFTSGGSFGISVGGTACSTSTWVSATSATCVTPSGTAGAKNVVITNNDGQTATLASAFTYATPTATKIAAKGFTTCALMSNQTVECWGENVYGGLGNGTTTFSGSPVQVSGLTGVTDISVGWYHSCAVAGGAVKCWGNNGSGELGNGTATNSSTPVTVSGLGGTAVKVAAGLYHSCAILSASPWIQCWGYNGDGELGNGSANSYTPVNVSLGSMPVTAAPTAIDAGAAHTCVIDGSASKNVWCWGYNGGSQLGNNSTTNSSTAVKAGTLSAASLVVNNYGTCAVATAGTIWCWGDGSWGEFGSNSGTTFSVPTQSGNKGLNATAVSTGTQVSITSTSGCAVLSTGGVTCWGSNIRGDQGNSSSTPNWDVPTFTNSNLTSISQVAGGALHMCALTTAGAVKCWGANSIGSLGLGAVTPQTPVTVSGISTAAQVRGSLGSEWMCARLSNGDVYCWGSTQNGLNGDGSSWLVDAATPAKVQNTSMGAAIDLSVGPNEACIVNTSNQVWCWGLDTNYTLSTNNTGNPTAPTQQTGISGAQKVFVGNSFVCATLSATPYVKCWGDNTYGQLGNGNNTASYTPQTVSGFTATPALLGGNDNAACATISSSPYLKCWGGGWGGKLGNGNTANSNTPVNASSVGLTAVPLDLTSNGLNSMCAVTSAGGVKCWGVNNNNGQNWTSGTFNGMLGDGSTTDTGNGSAATAGYPSAITSASKVGGGAQTMCAVFNPGASGTVQCWGDNNFAQAGAAPSGSAFSPITLPGSGYVSVAGSDNTTCALMNNNTVQCWGDGSGGQLGDGTFRQQNSPQTVTLF